MLPKKKGRFDRFTQHQNLSSSDRFTRHKTPPFFAIGSSPCESSFFAGAQGCGRLGDSFLWEGSMFVFQFVCGDGRGHVLAQGPQLKISSFGKEKEELKK